ncbi:hypothetical protein LTR37_018652 [Vermiconidia calcicola]|uniref:Uncharacterized protein n=1 Tax=Vermiconidia calcicola TaxID=1690605 RepID=A0ACC3MGA4_9PEZI|nr:hypothetical protein LTR37_018652 [Vermiconidia calcicola]
MQLSLVALAGVLLLGSPVVGQTWCYTQLAKKSTNNIPSTTFSLRVPLTVYTKITSTPSTTITPADVTTTIVETSTKTETEIVTSTSTSTVQPPAGFTPIAEQGDYVPKIKGREVQPRAAATTFRVDSKYYPKAVSCLALNKQYTTKTSTFTASTTATITLPPATQTSTATTTVTTTGKTEAFLF